MLFLTRQAGSAFLFEQSVQREQRVGQVNCTNVDSNVNCGTSRSLCLGARRKCSDGVWGFCFGNRTREKARATVCSSIIFATFRFRRQSCKNCTEIFYFLQETYNLHTCSHSHHRPPEPAEDLRPAMSRLQTYPSTQTLLLQF